MRAANHTHMLGTILFDLLVHTAPLVFRFCRFAVAELLRPKARINYFAHTYSSENVQYVSQRLVLPARILYFMVSVGEFIDAVVNVGIRLGIPQNI